MAKSKKAKQHHEAELSVFENYLLSSSTLSSKEIGDILKNDQEASASDLMLYG